MAITWYQSNDSLPTLSTASYIWKIKTLIQKRNPISDFQRSTHKHSLAMPKFSNPINSVTTPRPTHLLASGYLTSCFGSDCKPTLKNLWMDHNRGTPVMPLPWTFKRTELVKDTTYHAWMLNCLCDSQQRQVTEANWPVPACSPNPLRKNGKEVEEETEKRKMGKNAISCPFLTAFGALSFTPLLTPSHLYSLKKKK